MRRAAAKRNMPPSTKAIAEGMLPARPLRHQRIDAHERQHRPVRQRQPDGADLVVAGSARIDHAARDVEVRLGVAIVEDPAVESRRRRPRRRSDSTSDGEHGEARSTSGSVDLR